MQRSSKNVEIALGYHCSVFGPLLQLRANVQVEREEPFFSQLSQLLRRR